MRWIKMARVRVPWLAAFGDAARARDAALAARLRAIRARYPRTTAGLAIAAAVFAIAVVSATGWLVIGAIASAPDAAALRNIGTMSQATTLLDAQDHPAFTIFREQRIDVPLSRVSRRLIQAILAIEDQRFYDHAGFDLVRVA
jgi:membrane peptidoglycan carboxypeptidase